MNDTYTTPSESENLAEEQAGGEFGSVENGISGNYSLTVGGTISEAWRQVKGVKTQIGLAMLMLIVCMIVLELISSVVIETLFVQLVGVIFGPSIGKIVGTLLFILITTPLSMGLAIMGIQRMANAKICCSSIFNYWVLTS